MRKEKTVDIDHKEKDIGKMNQILKRRKWSEIKGANSWVVFKIMSEFVEGFNRLESIGPCISIFGSARVDDSKESYRKARKIANLLVDAGFGIITGGGKGIMEAANRGSKDYNGVSVGLTIRLPLEKNPNIYIDPDKMINFDYFFVRKVMLVKYAKGFIVMPGGLGTLDELFEAYTLIQTKKIDRFPIILVDKKYWDPLVIWIKETMLKKIQSY